MLNYMSHLNVSFGEWVEIILVSLQPLFWPKTLIGATKVFDFLGKNNRWVRRWPLTVDGGKPAGVLAVFCMGWEVCCRMTMVKGVLPNDNGGMAASWLMRTCVSNLPRFYVSLFYSDGEGCHQVGGNWLRLQAGWFFTSLHRYGRILCYCQIWLIISYTYLLYIYKITLKYLLLFIISFLEFFSIFS